MGSTSVALPEFLNREVQGLLIGDSQVESMSGRTFRATNPATGEVLAEVADGDPSDVDRAVAVAREAFEGPWSRWKPLDRQLALVRLAELVEQHYDELSLIDTLDMGAPWARTNNSRRPVALLHWYAGQAVAVRGETIPNSAVGDFFSYTTKEPIGVVGAIIPWNGPVPTTVWKLGPVLATGCTMVLKPAPEASLSALRIGELCLEAGIPGGVVNVVPGGSSVGEALAAHTGVDKIAFTGSAEVGQAITRASANNLKRLSLELGGKSPNIVFADADMDIAAAGAATAIFANSGQLCSAGSRLFVERSIYDEFVMRVAEHGASLKVGNGVDLGTQLGPLVSQQQLDRVLHYLDVGQREGAQVIAGGSRLTNGDYENGYFVPPTVFGDVHDDMSIARDEIFGPVLVALPFDRLDEVVCRANDTRYGLGAGVWTNDINRVQKLADRIKAGTVWINNYQTMDPAVPFGGYKMSGYGRESGSQHLEDYLNTKAVWLKVY